MSISGNRHRCLAARKLYENFSYVYCKLFGQYEPAPLSDFMTKAIG